MILSVEKKIKLSISDCERQTTALKKALLKKNLLPERLADIFHIVLLSLAQREKQTPYDFLKVKNNESIYAGTSTALLDVSVINDTVKISYKSLKNCENAELSMPRKKFNLESFQAALLKLFQACKEKSSATCNRNNSSKHTDNK